MRFLAKVDGSWGVSLRNSVVRKYKRSRLPFFLFGVDPSCDEIHWLDLLAALRTDPALRTFTLTSQQKLLRETA